MSAVPKAAAPSAREWTLACPKCAAPLGAEAALGASAACRACGSTWRRVSGIFDFLLPDRRALFERFLADYTRIRHEEGRGSASASWYLRLPETAPDDPLAWQWRIRAASYRALERKVLARLPRGAKVLDLGAGTGWLSHRAAGLGHLPCAVDVTVDERDGLLAARHFPELFPRVRAEFDHLPIAGDEADLVVYNASLHYSEDYARTLTEALRVLAPGGAIAVLDTPIYRSDESGRRMAAEKHADFERRFGTRSDVLPSREYLTWPLLDELGRSLGLTWTVTTPWYGLGWALRPLKARLQGKREPSRFALLVARRS